MNRCEIDLAAYLINQLSAVLDEDAHEIVDTLRAIHISAEDCGDVNRRIEQIHNGESVD